MAKTTYVSAGFILNGANNKTMMEKTLSETEALKRVQNGNREAYQVIVLRYMQTAYFIALGFVHNQQDALDISQDAFIRAFRKIKKFDIQKPFFPWFYKLLKNLSLDHIKRRKRLNEVPLEECRIFKKEKDNRELKATIWKGIEELTDDHREIIILRYFRQFSYQEIAEITDKPIGTVMSCLYYAKQRLKDVMGKYLESE